MAIEKLWAAVAPTLLTSNGTTDGKLNVADGKAFRVKMIVSLVDPTLPTNTATQQFQVNRRVRNTLYLGPIKQASAANNINGRSNLTSYTVSNGCYVYAVEQLKHTPNKVDQDFATYEQEPVVARRVITVDEQGDFYNQNNPVPVNIINGTADLRVQLTDKDNDPNIGDVHDSIRIGDGINEVNTTKAATGDVVGMNTVRKNSIFSKPYDKITVLTKNEDGDPLTIRTQYGGVNVQLATISYDSDGDFEDVQVSDL